MIEDARQLPPWMKVEADICIIGGGAAGLSVASALAGTKKRICILESGGLEFEHRAQRLSRGTLVGMPYEALDLCRVRQFGGSTGRSGWGGWCKALDPEDFETHSWIPLSGWPIAREALDRYYVRAAELLNLGEMLSPARQEDLDPSESPLFAEPCYLSLRPNIGKTLLTTMRDASTVRVLVHATALRMKTSPSGEFVEAVEVASTRRKRFFVTARAFVLAGGGIENARLLLLSDGQHHAGLGNQYDQVGRYFMEHPRVTWGVVRRNPAACSLTPFDPAPARRGRWLAAANAETKSLTSFGLAVRPEIRERMQLLGSRTWIKPSVDWRSHEGAEALQYVAFWLRKGRPHRDLLRSVWPLLHNPSGTVAAGLTRLVHARLMPRHYRFVTILEQNPDPLSRVTLDSRPDEFGARRARLDWRIGSLVQHTLERVQAMVAAETERLGHKCWIHPDGEHDPSPTRPPSFGWVRHHMGTTRMSDDMRTGVVDANCKVHGVNNLFVAGSSVFPTGGNDMPTLTILALALRLSEHLTALGDQCGPLSLQLRQAHQGLCSPAAAGASHRPKTTAA